MPIKIIKSIGRRLFGDRRSAAAPAPKSEEPDARPSRRSKGSSDPAQKAASPDRPARRRRRPAAEKASERVAESAPWTLDRFPVLPAEGKTRFHDFDLPLELMQAIADLGFQYCTPIQAQSLSHALAGCNVAGRAQTGTGKTAAFLIAIFTRLLREHGGRNDAPNAPWALVLAPTRELVVQICHDAELLGKYTSLRCLAVFGGMDYQRQRIELEGERGVDLVVATPGRLLDFQRQRVIDLSRVDTLVIDEADRMLDMGFIPDVRRIVGCLPPKTKRRTQLFSATLTEEVMRLAAQWMPDPVVVEIEPDQVAVDTVHQLVYTVRADQKFTVLCNLVLRYPNRRVLIFCNRRVSVDRLAEHLRRQGIQCEMLSGDVTQHKRLQVLEAFRGGPLKVVVATDVAGRGLHVADIDLVVNFELPYEPQDYVHRIGRTGRAGQKGTAVSFACEDESFVIPEIESLLGEPMKCCYPEAALLQPLARASAPSGRTGRGDRENRPRRSASGTGRTGRADPRRGRNAGHAR